MHSWHLAMWWYLIAPHPNALMTSSNVMISHQGQLVITWHGGHHLLLRCSVGVPGHHLLLIVLHLHLPHLLLLVIAARILEGALRFVDHVIDLRLSEEAALRFEEEHSIQATQSLAVSDCEYTSDTSSYARRGDCVKDCFTWMHEMKYEHSADATVILACSHESVEQPLQQEEQDLAPSICRGCHKQAIGAGAWPAPQLWQQALLPHGSIESCAWDHDHEIRMWWHSVSVQAQDKSKACHAMCNTNCEDMTAPL